MPKTTAARNNKTQKRKGTSASNKKITKAQAALLQEKKERQAILRREVWGIALIAAGLFFLLSILSADMGLIGSGFQSVLYGVFGSGAFIAPIAVMAWGVAGIAARKRKTKPGAIISIAVLTSALIIFGHLLSIKHFSLTTFTDYTNQGYYLGKNYGYGTGAAGAVFAFPFVKLLGAAGAYIISITAVFCSLLALTHVSIAKVGEQVGAAAKNTAEYIGRQRREHIEQKEAREKLEPTPASQTGRHRSRRDFYSEDLLDGAQTDPSDIPLTPIEDLGELGADSDMAPSVFELNRRENSTEITKPEDGGENADEPVQTEIQFPENQDIKPVFVVAEETVPASEKTQRAFVKSAEETVSEPYRFPNLELLNEPKSMALGVDPHAEMERGARTLEETLASFGISAKVVHVSRGPAITRFELTPAPGVKVSRITSLADDIALNLAAYGVRIEAPIPGKQAIGIEIPNGETSMVTLRETLIDDFFSHKSNIVAAIGKDIAGKVMLCDLAKMPHVLIAGATGSGKSVCINTIITSILYKSSPEDVRFIMIDPKVVELNVYNGIPHLLIPVVTDPKKASGALGWAVQEMTERYKKFAAAHTRDITGYNEYALREGLEKMPKIVIIIDELADLMAVAPADVEERIQRLAQLARAAGMHLVIATQRPSVNVITGVIKANIPSRIAFAVASQVDSRTILDMAGAEKLLGKGDMLYYPAGLNKPVRIQGAYISEDEVERLTEYIKNGEEAEYNTDIEMQIELGGDKKPDDSSEDEVDEKLAEAIEIAVDAGQISISMLQRKLEVGYPRAGKLIDAMERRKIISGFEGSKPRRTLITRADFERMYGSLKDDPLIVPTIPETMAGAEKEAF